MRLCSHLSQSVAFAESGVVRAHVWDVVVSPLFIVRDTDSRNIIQKFPNLAGSTLSSRLGIRER